MSTGITVFERLPTTVGTSLHEHWILFLVEGLVLLVLGLTAVVLPQFATYAIESIVGWLFLASGLAGMITTLWMRRAAGFWWALLSALLGIATGAILLRWPLSRALSLTVIVGAFFVMEGIASLMLALDHKRIHSERWGWLLASGIIDLGLSGMILSGLPATAAWAIGLLLGINLVFGGSALVGMALRARTSAPSSVGRDASVKRAATRARDDLRPA
jgi:uncharacterized membrane protein HdeD (DUF308 family)